MGYAHYELTDPNGGQKIEAGYGVEALCDKPDCTATISRGLNALCGEKPGGDEYGCGRWFCDDHLYLAPEREHGWRCSQCLDEQDRLLDTSPDAMVVTFSNPTGPARETSNAKTVHG